jgi:GNAT superfamily N-acetyltransferase
MLRYIEGQGDLFKCSIMPLLRNARMGYYVTELQTQQHIEDLISMGRVFAAEAGPHLDFDPDEVRSACNVVLNDFDREFFNFFIAYKDDEPVGFIYAICGKYLFNKQRYAQQELIYVRPAYRGTRAFLKLVKAFEEWARLRSSIEIWMGSAHSKQFSDILPRIGYPEAGTYHKKRTV